MLIRCAVSHMNHQRVALDCRQKEEPPSITHFVKVSLHSVTRYVLHCFKKQAFGF